VFSHNIKNTHRKVKIENLEAEALSNLCLYGLSIYLSCTVSNWLPHNAHRPNLAAHFSQYFNGLPLYVNGSEQTMHLLHTAKEI